MTEKKNNEKLSVLFVTPEIVPYKSSGGLADVSEALPLALKNRDIDIIRIMPKYKGIEHEFNLEQTFSFTVEIGNVAQIASVFKHTDEEGILTYFIANYEFFERDGLYGFNDDGARFGFFCKAVLELMLILDYQPDIVHLNDWQTALIALYIREEYKRLYFYEKTRIIFTIHNIQYQGMFGGDILNALGISYQYLNPQSIEYYGVACFMKAGIVYSDFVTTVSETYAKEIQWQEYGYGLDGMLRDYSYKVRGILNGIYYDKYDPEKDPALKFNFNSKNFKTQRPKQKTTIQEQLGLPVKKVPLFGVITRLANQKGIELILDAIRAFLNEDVQFVILGTGETYYEQTLRDMQAGNPDKVSANILFDKDLSHAIYGGVDFFLMPSLFEPCGLSQMYSLRYGSIPIVRRTGGLRDTIVDYHEDYENSNGFVFDDYHAGALIHSMRRAVDVFYNKNEMNKLIKRGMDCRFSWDKSALGYIDLYEAAVKHRQ